MVKNFNSSKIQNINSEQNISDTINQINEIQDTSLKNLENTIKNLNLITYKTRSSLYAIPQIIAPLNSVFIEHYNSDNLVKYLYQLLLFVKKCTYLSFAGKGLFWGAGTHTIFSLGYSMIMQKYLTPRYQTIVEQTKIKKHETIKKTIELVNATKKRSDTGLTTHTTNNYLPICASYEDPSVPVYEPKTIIEFLNLRTLLKTQKNRKKLLSDLNYVANLTIDERGQYLESLIKLRKITAEDCKIHNLPEILIGQNGIFAVKDIPRFTVIGYYSGIYFTELEKFLKYKKETGAATTTYMFRFPETEIPRLSGFMYGNHLSCINAGTTYFGSIKKIAKEIFENCSVNVVYAKSLEYPDPAFVKDLTKFDLVAYVSNRVIKKGEQLLVNYGKDYWSTRFDNVTISDDDSDKINDLVTAYRVKELEQKSKKTENSKPKSRHRQKIHFKKK